MTEWERLEAAWAELDAAQRADPPPQTRIRRLLAAVLAYLWRKT